MGDVPLARLWQLADGTTCLLLKDGRALNWELRVLRGEHVVQHENFSNPIVAMDEAKVWRERYAASRASAAS